MPFVQMQQCSPTCRSDRTRTLHDTAPTANADARSDRQVDRGGTIYAASRPFPQLAERNYHTCPHPPMRITKDGSPSRRAAAGTRPRARATGRLRRPRPCGPHLSLNLYRV